MKKENKIKEIKPIKNNKYNITFRVIQAICFGVFALGISNAFGDYSKFVQSPISAFSITTSIFGGMGIIITEIMARISKKW